MTNKPQFSPNLTLDNFFSDTYDIDYRQQSFVGVWKTLLEKNLTTIIPYWSHLDFSSMLEQCLGAGTIGQLQTERVNNRIDFFEVLSSPTSVQKTWVFSIAPDEPPVETDFTVGSLGQQFASMAFISELRKLLLRKRRLTYETKQATYSGRVKGKILIGETFRKHVVRNRPDRIECAVPTRTDNNRVNQVFRYTLRLCKESLLALPAKELRTAWAWATFCEDVLSNVDEIRSTRDTDYVPHGLNGFYREHGNLLALARLLKSNHQSTSFVQPTPGQQLKTIPYLLNTSFVFERWVCARAAAVAKTKGWTCSFSETAELDNKLPFFLPDIVFKNSQNPNIIRILDAKYKTFWQKEEKVDYKKNPNEYQSWRRDTHQALAYKVVFNAERTGLIFPSEGKRNHRSGLSSYPTPAATGYFCLLPVCPPIPTNTTASTTIDDVIKAFLS